MAKRPFSIRIEQSESNRFKAIATVRNMDSAKLFVEMIRMAEKNMSEKERSAYNALLNLWQDVEID